MLVATHFIFMLAINIVNIIWLIQFMLCYVLLLLCCVLLLLCYVIVVVVFCYGCGCVMLLLCYVVVVLCYCCVMFLLCYVIVVLCYCCVMFCYIMLCYRHFVNIDRGIKLWTRSWNNSTILQVYVHRNLVLSIQTRLEY